MSKTQIFTFALLFFFAIGQAQNGQPMAAGARGAGMGNAGIGFQDIHSLFSNQAGLAALKQTSFTAIGESRYSDFGIRSLGAGVGIPGNAGTFGLAVQYFGIADYNEQKVGLAYARKLFEKFSVGIQMDYLHLRIQDYGSRNLFTFEIGIQSQVSKNLRLGFYTYSPVQVEIVPGENLPTLFRIGGGYQISKKLYLAAEIEKDIDFPAEVHIGLEYALIEALDLRLGAQTNPSELSFGVGYHLKEKLNIDIAASYHQFLGVTPTFNATYLLAQKKKKR